MAFSPSRQSKLRKVLVSSISLIFLILLAGLTFPERLLCIDSGPVKADYLVVLGGEADQRAAHAADLFKAGVAPRILVTGQGDTDLGRMTLISRGVPASAIQLERDSRNTKENAEFSVRMLRAAGAKRVVLVTSWFHSRRALATFRHAAPDLSFYSSPAYYDLKWSEWNCPEGHRMGVTVALEYLKTVVYAVRYGVY